MKKQLELPENSSISGLNFIGDDIENQTLIFAQSNGKLWRTEMKLENDHDKEESKQEELYQAKMRNDDRLLLAMAQKNKQQYLLLGQFLPQIYDLEAEKCTWKGKNVPNDDDDLEVPLYDTDGHFLYGSEKEFLICNGFGKLRLYDISRSSRPVIDVQGSDEIIHKIATSKWSNYAFYARQKGTITKADIRMNFRTVLNLKGPTGSVTDIKVWGDFVAWVSYDRYLKVYHHESRIMMANIYLKQKLESLLLDHTTIDQIKEDYKEKLEFEKQEEQRIFNETFDKYGHPIRRKRKRENDNMFEEKEKLQKTDEN